MNIKQVGERVGMSPANIRYYESEGLIPIVKRTSSGVRDFSETDIEFIKFAQKMRFAGMSIKNLRRYVGLVIENNDGTIPERIKLFEQSRIELKEKLDELQKNYDLMGKKIKYYSSSIRAAEGKVVGMNNKRN
ncbi:MerR family transcriptional regulator [Weissella paramesenteroides]|uniref:MerR family transcriptional regulator n=1 Tax=Weissella paramesenteroides TaxID=1249 RepID=UPI0023F73096|nr:MerR family transcriptional regulator [Weissella paramesenteroides]MDF8373931.1 MerR family transcriptional regulator [Weissella paramesenteroides]WIG65471.1 MerR family transcriptional regulator [Weissella paramesenteroides]